MNIVACVGAHTLLARDENVAAIGIPPELLYVNPWDLWLVNEAVRLRDMAVEGSVKVQTVAPPYANEYLLEQLTSGVDAVRPIWDDQLPGSDVAVVALVHARAIMLEPCDLVLCSDRTADAGLSPLAPAISETLGWPGVSGVVRIEADSGSRLRLYRRTESRLQVLSGPMPAILGLNPGGQPAGRGSAAGTSPVRPRQEAARDIANLGLSPAEVGRAGSATEAIEVIRPKPVQKPDSRPPSARTRTRDVVLGPRDRRTSVRVIQGTAPEVAHELATRLRAFMPPTGDAEQRDRASPRGSGPPG